MSPAIAYSQGTIREIKKNEAKITVPADTATPVEIRQTMMEAGLKWNEAFKNAARSGDTSTRGHRTTLAYLIDKALAVNK